MQESEKDVHGSKIDVSIVVYARNARRNLPRCLRALQNQSLRASAAMEVIVVDGASGDRTHEIALEFQTADPDFIRIHRQSDADAFCARQTGLALARGTYVAFHEAHEFAQPGMYETLYDACEENALAFAGANIWDRALRNMLLRRDFLLANHLPVKTGCDRAEQLAAYDALRKLVRPLELSLFCAGWIETLRSVCLEEYREARGNRKTMGGAAFYEWMISLAGEPQVMETMALARRSALDRGHQRFFDAFRKRDWVKVEKGLKNSRLPWRGARPSLPENQF